MNHNFEVATPSEARGMRYTRLLIARLHTNTVCRRYVDGLSRRRAVYALHLRGIDDDRGAA